MSTATKNIAGDAIRRMEQDSSIPDVSNIIAVNCSATPTITIELELQRVVTHVMNHLRAALINEACAVADEQVTQHALQEAATKLFGDGMELDQWLADVFAQLRRRGYSIGTEESAVDAAIEDVHRDEDGKNNAYWRITDAVNADAEEQRELVDGTRDLALGSIDYLQRSLLNASRLASAERGSSSMNIDDVIAGSSVFTDQNVEAFVWNVINKAS